MLVGVLGWSYGLLNFIVQSSELSALFVSLFYMGVGVERFMVGCLMLVFVLRLNVIWVVPCIFWVNIVLNE